MSSRRRISIPPNNMHILAVYVTEKVRKTGFMALTETIKAGMNFG